MRQVAIVTGADKGIGLEVVRKLCKKFNGDVYLTSRMRDKGQEAIEQLKQEGLNPKYHELDISQPDSIRMFQEFISKNYGGIDLLINNAGVSFGSETVPVFRQAQLCHEVDFMGTLNMNKIFLPLLRPHARVVNLTNSYIAKKSVLGEHAQKKFDLEKMTLNDLWLIMDYYLKMAKAGTQASNGLPESPKQMAKIAIVAMTKILARDIKSDSRRNILINGCCPGWTRTGGSAEFIGKNGYCVEADLQKPDAAASNVIWVATIKPGQSSPNGEIVHNQQVVSCDF